MLAARYVPKWTFHQPFLDCSLFHNGDIGTLTLEAARAAANQPPFDASAIARLIVTWAPCFGAIAMARALGPELSPATLPVILSALAAQLGLSLAVSVLGKRALVSAKRSGRRVGLRSGLIALAMVAFVTALMFGIVLGPGRPWLVK